MAIKDTFDHTAGRLVSCGDAQIYVEEIGNHSRPVLLMLHGGFGNVEDFNSIAPTLSRQFRLIGLDSRGHGKSSIGSGQMSYELLTDDLAQVIDSLELKEFNIFGFSDGGIIAYRFAARQDPRLGKIVTVGSSWEMSENEPAWDLISVMTAEIWKKMFPSSYESYMRLNPNPDFDRFAKAVVSMWTDLSPDGHPESLMGRINNEMLIIRGDNDPLTSLDSMVKLRRVAKNTSFLNIPFAAHVAFDDAPDMVLSAVGKFFGVSLVYRLN